MARSYPKRHLNRGAEASTLPGRSRPKQRPFPVAPLVVPLHCARAGFSGARVREWVHQREDAPGVGRLQMPSISPPGAEQSCPCFGSCRPREEAHGGPIGWVYFGLADYRTFYICSAERGEARTACGGLAGCPRIGGNKDRGALLEPVRPQQRPFELFDRRFEPFDGQRKHAVVHDLLGELNRLRVLPDVLRLRIQPHRTRVLVE